MKGLKKLVATIKNTISGMGKIARKDKVTVSADARGIYIDVKGYSSANGGEIIMLENWGGQLRVHIWADINIEDPSHTINLERAKESAILTSLKK